MAQAGTALPRLDPRQWIVVPFNNVTRAADVDWLRDASVNLLTMEIGRWTDVQVVNDKRVGDLLRALPADRRAQALTLSDGLQLARQAGAGMLVMGDFVKLGRGARLSANVFDVRTGARVRTAEHRLGDADSVLAAFGPLSRGVLAVPPPPDSRSGDIGTSNLQAYQAYLAGMRALNRWQLDVADRELKRALTLDSTFALAHLFMSMTLGWTETGGFDEAISHALAAQRLGASLPPRERALIAAQLAIARSEYDEGCRITAPFVARDSNDVLALYMLGDCAYHDVTVIPGAHDSLPGREKWGRNLSLAMMRRVLTLDPSFHQAFRHILDILRALQLNGCVKPTPTAPCESWRAAMLRDGDTLLVQPVSPRNSAGFARQQARASIERSFIANVALARRIADDWLGSDSTDSQARLGLALVLLSQGDVAAAEAQFRRVPSVTLMQGDGTDTRTRMESAMKAYDAVTARAWFDSLVTMIPDNRNIAANPFRGSMELVFARAGRVHAALASISQRTAAAAGGGTPAATAYLRAAPRMYLGFATPDVGQLEAAYLATMQDTATCRGDCRALRVHPSLTMAFRAPRTSWPSDLRFATGLHYQPARALMLGDSALLRVAAQRLDSSAHSRVAMGWPDDGHAMIGAEAFLALRDSANALRLYRFAVDSAIALIPIMRGGFGHSHAAWWTRAMRVRAELAAAMGHPDEARLWYDRVLAFYAEADPEFQPDIERLRASRRALGASAAP